MIKLFQVTYNDQANLIAEVLQKGAFRTRPWVQWGTEQNSWNIFNTLETLIDYTRITGNRRYMHTIQLALADKVLIGKALEDGVDDEAWAGIVMIKAYRLTRERVHLETAKAIFTNMTTYWDDTCGGGVWWNFKKTYKNAITNELFFVLAMLLYRETGAATYLEWGKKEWDWFARTGLINSDNLINDGLSNCKNNGGDTWTYNQGVVLGGLTELYRATKDRIYLEQAQKIAASVMTRLVVTQDGQTILKEVGGDLNTDQQQFKGIFFRYLTMLALALPEEGNPGRKAIREFTHANVAALWKNARNEANQINAYWHVGERKSIYTSITQTAALDLLNAAIALKSAG